MYPRQNIYMYLNYIIIIIIVVLLPTQYKIMHVAQNGSSLRFSITRTAGWFTAQVVSFKFFLRAISHSVHTFICAVTLGRFAVISRLAIRDRHSIRPAKTVVRNYRIVHALCVSLQTWRTTVAVAL